MFHPDNIKDTKKSDHVEVSLSVYKYWYEMGGPTGLTQGLNTNPKVSFISLTLLLRPVSKVTLEISNKERGSNYIYY